MIFLFLKAKQNSDNQLKKMEVILAMLPDINRSLYSSQVSRLEPPITMRTSYRGCIVQVDCPEFKDDEVTFQINEYEIQIFGTRSPGSLDFHRPTHFHHKLSLGFDPSTSKAKSVFLDGSFFVFFPKMLNTHKE